MRGGSRYLVLGAVLCLISTVNAYKIGDEVIVYSRENVSVVNPDGIVVDVRPFVVDNLYVYRFVVDKVGRWYAGQPIDVYDEIVVIVTMLGRPVANVRVESYEGGRLLYVGFTDDNGVARVEGINPVIVVDGKYVARPSGKIARLEIATSTISLPFLWSMGILIAFLIIMGVILFKKR